MLRRFSIIFILFLVFGPTSARALEVPKRPAGYVNDRADLISANVEHQLEAALRSYETKTSNQIVVATFPSLDNQALEDFSIRLADAWKPGQKDKDNGVILLVFKAERKMRIEVGYGLEGAIPDALAGQIIMQEMTPFFKQGEYDKGIVAGAAAIMMAAEGEYRPSAMARGGNQSRRPMTPAEKAAAEAQAKAIMILILIVGSILFLVDGGRYINYRRGHKLHKEAYSFWEWFFRFAILLAVLSILFRVLFYAMLFSRGGSSGGRGGFSGGGGGFGGGGASGSW